MLQRPLFTSFQRKDENYTLAKYIFWKYLILNSRKHSIWRIYHKYSQVALPRSVVYLRFTYLSNRKTNQSRSMIVDINPSDIKILETLIGIVDFFSNQKPQNSTFPHTTQIPKKKQLNRNYFTHSHLRKPPTPNKHNNQQKTKRKKNTNSPKTTPKK